MILLDKVIDTQSEIAMIVKQVEIDSFLVLAVVSRDSLRGRNGSTRKYNEPCK